MTPRNIERYNLGYTIDESVLLWVKRVSFGFAGVAIALGVADIAGYGGGHNNNLFSGNNFFSSPARASVAPAPLQPRVQIASADASFAPRIDDGAVVVRIPVAVTPAKPESGVVGKLVQTQKRDAFELAMAPPAAEVAPAADAAVTSNQKALTMPAPAPDRPIQLASVETGITPEQASEILAISKPVSPSVVAVIPLNKVPLPRPAPPPSPAEMLGLVNKDYSKAQRCLANAIYFEARSEPVRGQMAVAQVVMNRVFSGFYPEDVCGVVYQNASRHLSCQFTFACDGKSKAIHDRGSWVRANRIATETLDGKVYLPEVAKSTHYHASYVRPVWAREMKKLAKFGLHQFYRPFAWGNGAGMPVWGQAYAQAIEKKKN